jgi:hypothetical protein
MSQIEQSDSLSDSLTEGATNVDRLFNAWLGRLTLSMSPAGLMLAYPTGWCTWLSRGQAAGQAQQL